MKITLDDIKIGTMLTHIVDLLAERKIIDIQDNEVTLSTTYDFDKIGYKYTYEELLREFIILK